MACVRQTRPGSGLGFQVKVRKTFEMVASLPESGPPRSLVGGGQRWRQARDNRLRAPIARNLLSISCLRGQGERGHLGDLLGAIAAEHISDSMQPSAGQPVRAIQVAPRRARI